MVEGPPMVWVLWKVQLCSAVCMRAYIRVCVCVWKSTSHTNTNNIILMKKGINMTESRQTDGLVDYMTCHEPDQIMTITLKNGKLSGVVCGLVDCKSCNISE